MVLLLVILALGLELLTYLLTSHSVQFVLFMPSTRLFPHTVQSVHFSPLVLVAPHTLSLFTSTLGCVYNSHCVGHVRRPGLRISFVLTILQFICQENIMGSISITAIRRYFSPSRYSTVLNIIIPPPPLHPHFV